MAALFDLADSFCLDRYDNHRLDILRAGSRHQAGGGSQFAGGEAPEDEVDLFPYFSSTCFSGYKDGPAVTLLPRSCSSMPCMSALIENHLSYLQLARKRLKSASLH